VRVQKVVSKEVEGLGQKIKAARMLKGLETGIKQKDLAKAAGISIMTWNRLERETQPLDIATLRKIEAVLDVDFGVSLDDTDMRLPQGLEQLLEGEDKTQLMVEGLWLAIAKVKVLSHNELDARFGLKKGTTATMNSRLAPDAFVKWTSEHDPDFMVWAHLPGKRNGYRIDLEASERLCKERENKAVLSDPKVVRALADAAIAV